MEVNLTSLLSSMELRPAILTSCRLKLGPFYIFVLSGIQLLLSVRTSITLITLLQHLDHFLVIFIMEQSSCCSLTGCSELCYTTPLILIYLFLDSNLDTLISDTFLSVSVPMLVPSRVFSNPIISLPAAEALNLSLWE